MAFFLPHHLFAGSVPETLCDGLVVVLGVRLLALGEGGAVVGGHLGAYLCDDRGLPLVQDALLQDALLGLGKADLEQNNHTSLFEQAKNVRYWEKKDFSF